MKTPKETPVELRYIVEYWDNDTNRQREHGRYFTFEKANEALERIKGCQSTCRLIEIRRLFTDQY